MTWTRQIRLIWMRVFPSPDELHRSGDGGRLCRIAMLDCSEGAHSFRVKSRPERSLLEVKWFRQRRGRSAELDEAGMLARAEDAVALALEAADQASKASASMTDCLAQLAADRQAKKLKEEDDARLGSFLGPLIVCAASLAAAIGVGLKVPAAFSDPRAQLGHSRTI